MHVSAPPTLTVGKLVWQPRPGTFVMTVICKATYALRNGPCQLLETPGPPVQADVYWQDGASRSVCVPNDFAPFKRHVDVMLVGHAWAPHGQAITSLVTRFAVGPVNKTIAVYGDRFWLPDGSLSKPAPFTKMPLSWSRAAGGPRSWNPAGIPPRIDASVPRQLPNLEPVGFVLRGPQQEIPPVGFGPIAPHWPTRVEHLRMHRAAWSHEAWHEEPLPADVDGSYFNVAPEDQQIAQLPAQARILLEHVDPEEPLLIADIEDVLPRASVTRHKGAPQEVWLRADTLLVDVDRRICNVTWRAVVPLRHPQEEGTVVVTPTRGKAALGPTPSAATTHAQPKLPATPPLASEDDTTRTHVAPQTPATSSMLPLSSAPVAKDDVRTGTLVLTQQPAPSSLPFHAPMAQNHGRADTLLVTQQPAISSLPFHAGAQDSPLDETETETETETERKPSVLGEPAVPPVQPIPAEQPPFLLPAAHASAPPVSPAPFALSGALGYPSPVERPPAVPFPAPSTATVTPVAAASPRENRELPPVSQGQAFKPRSTLSIEQYARIKAELWGTRTRLHEVLTRYGIDEVAWRVQERQHAEAIAVEAREGRCDLALALCAAFEAAKAPGVAPPPLGGLNTNAPPP